MAPIAAKSPRAVKRMINLYRLIRVGYRGDQLKLLLAEGGDGVPTYRELILALAWETGFSAASRAKLRACAMQPAPPNWQAVSLKECLDGGEAASFQEVLPHLSGLRLKRLFNAVEEVRRYSFSDWT